jgi:hypothetical protein
MRIAAIALLAAFAAPAAAAQPAAEPVNAATPRAGEWQVNEDREGCTAALEYRDGTSFVLAYDSYARTGFIFLGNPGWRSIEAGREYPFTVELYPLAVHDLRGRGAPVEGLGGFTIRFSGVELITEFMEAEMLVVQTGRNVVGRYSLEGSYGAAIALARCNRRALDRVKPDPFAQ